MSTSVSINLLCPLLIAMLSTIAPSASDAFPSLFNRPKLFQRQQVAANQPPQAFQQQQSQHHEQLIPTGSNNHALMPMHLAMMPNQFSGLNQQDLMRLNHRGQQQLQAQPSLPMEEMMSLIPQPEVVPMLQPMASMHQARSQQHQNLVNKIEQHVGQHFDMALNNINHQAAAASGYSPPTMSSRSNEQMMLKQRASQEREAAASEEPAEYGAEESEKQEEPKAEQGEEKKEEEGGAGGGEQEQNQNHPEAFEIHHKKGGKSYQYFHQGHAQ